MASVNGEIDFWCSAKAVVSSLGGDPTRGLAQAEVEDQRRRYGPNRTLAHADVMTSGRITLICTAFVFLVEVVKRFNGIAPKQRDQG